jgi:DNA (cytosine-5)-methyltransferase 1
MKVLNLYAGIGGNRKLWTDVEVTAVELKPEIASIYKDFFPNDNVVVGDAHAYLLEHYDEFDFIWSSPPCPSHSRMRMLWKGDGSNISNPNKKSGKSMKFPDMKLYEEIIFLKHFFTGKFCVENVISYYDPLIPPIESDNHYFWTNFHFSAFDNQARGIRGDDYKSKPIKFDLSKYELPTRFKRQVTNNLVRPELGLHIFNESKKSLYQELFT